MRPTTSSVAIDAPRGAQSSHETPPTSANASAVGGVASTASVNAAAPAIARSQASALRSAAPAADGG
jgi:hypothetical protein